MAKTRPQAEDYLPLYKKSPLFKGMVDDEILAVLKCLDAHFARYEKDSYLFHMGDTTTKMGLVLSGSLRLEHEDYWGNRTIIASIGTGQSFAEMYACEPSQPFNVNVIAAENTLVIMMDVHRITTMCTSACKFHTRLVRNLMAVLARRAFSLNRKIEHTSKRTTREKLLSYLSDQAREANSSRFSIPFNRQELADYLSVDRSAMSAELSKMHADGILNYEKNHFEIMRLNS